MGAVKAEFRKQLFEILQRFGDQLLPAVFQIDHGVIAVGRAGYDLLGKDEILAAIKEELGIDLENRTSPDGMWSLKTVECMGACTSAPMMDINGRYYEYLTPDKTRDILRRVKEGTEELPAAPAEFADHPEVAYSYGTSTGEETTG